MKKISIIVPTLNEEANVAELIRRFDAVFSLIDVEYEIIFIDDHSTDGTQKNILDLAAEYPVSMFLKKGKKGRIYSLIEGFELAQYPVVATIDADLRYAPEDVLPMLEKLDSGFDMVVAKRISKKTSFMGKILKSEFSLLFSQWLHDFDFDVQSGLKVFRKQILEEVGTSLLPETFELEFLIKARNYGHKIGSYDITFGERKKGKSKKVFLVEFFKTFVGFFKLKFKRHKPLLIKSEDLRSMSGAGMAHNRKRFITHTTLHHDYSAINTFSIWQGWFIFSIPLVLIVGFFLNPMRTAIILIAVLSFVYFVDVFLNLFLALRSLKNPPEISFSDEELEKINISELPVYSILCPLYKEANILPTFVDAVSKLDWPKDKLEAMLLLEEDDQETIKVAKEMNLPDFVKIVVVPHSMPKTKPKACNYGLCLATGEYVVIYDAEDIPEPAQLKKAFLGFQKLPKDVRCLQAKLNYFNPHQNILTRLFTAEYSLWFDLSLPGMQSIETSIPLGGTSNHFRRADLLELEGWDPFNVTEDCDLGVRIFSRGYKTAIIDSVTLEEANSKFFNWLKQRSRWIKGYMQTYLVHMRDPISFFKQNGFHALLFQMFVGGKLMFILINPILWLATISYFTLYRFVGPMIEALYPPAVFYMAGLSLVFGNFLAMYYYMLGCAKRQHWSLIKYVFLIPFYWLMVSAAGIMALYQLFVKPHYWEKTLHGLHIKTKKIKKEKVREIKFEKKEKTKSEFGLWGRTTSLLKKIREQKFLKLIFSNQGLFLQMVLFSNFVNFIFNAYLGRMLSFKELGLVTVVNTLWYVMTIFVMSFGSMVNHRSAHLSAAKNASASLGFLQSLMEKSVIFVFAILAMWVLASPFTSKFLNISDNNVLLFFTAAIFFGIVTSSLQGFLQGNLFFITAGIIILVESLSKLFIAIFLVSVDASSLVYLSIPISVVFASLVAVALLMFKNIKPKKPKKFSFPTNFFAASILTNISTAMFLSLDIVLVKHYFSPEIAGQYALLSLVGKMIFFLGSMPGAFMITFVSRYVGLKKNPAHVLKMIYLASAAIVFIGFTLLGILGNITIPFLFGAKSVSIIRYLPLYTFALSVFTLTNVIVFYHLSRKNYFFNVLSFLMSVSMVVGFVLFHRSINDIVWIIFDTSLFGCVVISFSHYFEDKLIFLKTNAIDFVDAFFGKLPEGKAKKSHGKNILIFNWRDMRHEFAGGAEVYVQEIAKLWVKQGNHVTVFCGNDSMSPRSEVIDGVEIVRRGGFYFVYVWAFIYYMVRFRGKYDVVIDCQNGVPFFTPIYSKEPVFCLMHHVHQEVFFRHLPKPLALFASWLEKDLMPLVYRKVKFITVSQSSKDEMEKIGLGKEGIQIIHTGVHLNEFVQGEREPEPMIIYLGRLKAYKSVDILIRAFCQVKEKYSNAKLVIAGCGDAEKYLKDLAIGLGLSDQQIIFKGKVSEEEKINLLQRAWVLVNPSFMEGWGIVVIEANACGTPVVAADVPGLRDSVRTNESGYLVPYGNIDEFTNKISTIIEDEKKRGEMNIAARKWAENFDWTKSSDSFLSFITGNEKYESNK